MVVTRKDAVETLHKLINSGILDMELELKLGEIAEHICANDFEACDGDPDCEGCMFLKT